MMKIILDTDIGDDIDDLMALALVLCSEELDLIGVTTVLKNTTARGALAQTVLQVGGRGDIPVAVGCGAPMSPRVDQPFDALASYLDGEIPIGQGICLPRQELPKLDDRHAIDFVIEAATTGDKEAAIISIGPMTNLAMAMVKEPRIIDRIARIVAMAGAFDDSQSEWNIRCDPVAAAKVFSSGIPVDVVGYELTEQVVFQENDLERIYACSNPLAVKTAEAIGLWRKGIKQPWHLPRGHDVLAVSTLLEPDVVTWRSGEVRVDLSDSDRYGYTSFAEKTNGVHRVAQSVNVRDVIALWLNRVLAE